MTAWSTTDAARRTKGKAQPSRSPRIGDRQQIPQHHRRSAAFIIVRARRLFGTSRHSGVTRGPDSTGRRTRGWRRRRCLDRGPAQLARGSTATWVGIRRFVGPEQGVSGRPRLSSLPLCLWWSEVAARGRRPPAMDGRRNGHGRRRSTGGQPARSDESPRTRLGAGHSGLWPARVTPKRRGEPAFSGTSQPRRPVGRPTSNPACGKGQAALHGVRRQGSSPLTHI